VFQVQLAKSVDAVPLTRDYVDDRGASRPEKRSPVSAVGA
jgi:hypothetical protein